MISAIISFLGGSVFRMIWGEVSTWVTAKQNHAQELERLRLQANWTPRSIAGTWNLSACRRSSE